MLGRAVQLAGSEPVTQLAVGMDFRRPEYRREVFLRFYEFHLKYRTHPGLIYLIFPFLSETYGWGMEEKLWFAFINGNTQNPVTSWLLFQQCPSVTGDFDKLGAWFQQEYPRLAFDTDRRHQKPKFMEAVLNYRRLLRGRTQGEYFADFLRFGGGPEGYFRALWKEVMTRFAHFGRLSSFSYLEYLKVMGLPLECDQLFLEDMSGSKSHRNGLCKVLGRDDLDWHASNPSFDGHYSEQTLAWLRWEGAELRREARERMQGQSYFGDVGYFTLESALCTFKSWSRPNRRYPNVYADMYHDRIKAAEAKWGSKFSIFWQSRQALPRHLRLEDNPKDPGVKPEKQNVYRTTGRVIMMHRDWACFANEFNDRWEAR